MNPAMNSAMNSAMNQVMNDPQERTIRYNRIFIY